MATKKHLLYNLAENTSERPGILKLINSMLLGDKNIEFYDNTKVYNKQDIIFYVDPVTGKETVYKCAHDNVSGEFNPDEWDEYKVLDNVMGGGMSFSDNEPDDKNISLWFKRMNPRTIKIPSKYR